MSEFDDLVQDLKRMRDELRLQMHLASKDMQDEWEELEAKTSRFMDKAKLGETSEGLGDAFGQLGKEIKKGYERIAGAFKED